MSEIVSRAAFAQHKKANVALIKAADLAVDTSDVGVASRTAPFIISTAAVDRDGDTLALDGWDLVDYKKNPIVLFDHNPAQPIGRSEQIWIADGALRAIAWFPSKDVSELSDSIFKLIEANILRTSSVTFLPLEFSQALDRASSSPWGQPPMNFKRQKLLEWSVVSVPSNQEALKQGKALKVDWKAYQQVLERALDSDIPLDAPRVNYEQTHAVVKSFLARAAKSPAKGTDNNPMKTSKAGNVLNKDNLARMQAAQKHMSKAMEIHKEIDAMKDDASKHMDKCAEHMKCIMDSHKKGKEGDTDESGDSATESDDAGSKKVDEENEESKTQDGEGSEDNVNEKPVGDGKVTPDAKPNIPGPEDYYEEFRAKKSHDEDVIARARAALSAGNKPAKKSILEEATDEEMKQAVAIVVERQRQKHLRALRGQD